MKAREKKSTRTTKGNPYIKRIMCEIAWTVTRKRESYLGGWYWKVKQRRGAKKALIALARKILTVIYSILKNPDVSYSDEFYFEIQKKVAERRYSKTIKELTQNGFKMEPVIPV